MMPSNGPPTPQGVGGPTPPLVSRGSEEEGGKRISSEGLPPWVERDIRRPPPGRRRSCRPTTGLGGRAPATRRETRNPPPPTGKGENVPHRRKGYTTCGRAEQKPGENMVTANSKDPTKRHEEPIRVGNCACWTPRISFPLRGPDDPLGE